TPQARERQHRPNETALRQEDQPCVAECEEAGELAEQSPDRDVARAPEFFGRMTRVIFVGRIVDDEYPRSRADRKNTRGRAESNRSPAIMLDEQSQRDLREQRADVAHHQPKSREHRKPASRKPM